MHEQAIAKVIIAEAKKQEELNGKLKSITVEVGDVAHLPANEMKDVLSNLVPDWGVNVLEKKAKVECNCDFVGEPNILEKGHDHNVFKCQKCGELMPKILEGDKIVLVSVEVK